MSDFEKMLTTVEHHRCTWDVLPPEDAAALRQLEEVAGEVNAENVMAGEKGNKALADFAGKVYRVLHWVADPDCRKNHPNWSPTRAEEEKP